MWLNFCIRILTNFLLTVINDRQYDNPLLTEEESISILNVCDRKIYLDIFIAEIYSC